MNSVTTPHGIARLSASALAERRAHAVVLVGGQLLVRAARHSVLARAGFEIVADVTDAAGGAEAAQLHRAGVVLVDSGVLGGPVRAVCRLVERAPGAAVLVVAPELDREVMLAVLRAGAAGFVPETVGVRGLIRAVDVALAGEAVVPRAGVSTIIEQVRGTGQQQSSVGGHPLRLTRREADVIARLHEGMTPKEIAHELDLSAVTIRRHLSSAAKKARQAHPYLRSN